MGTRGIYTAGSGMLTAARDISTRNNNLANVSTPGYKQDILATTTFAESLALRRQTSGTVRIGAVALGRKADELVTMHTQGAQEPTHQPLDFAIEGNGYFAVETPAGGEWYTRNGQFQLDGEGYLVTGQGLRVLGENGPLQVHDYEFAVSEEGVITNAQGAQIGRFRVVTPEDAGTGLIKTGEGMFQLQPDAVLAENTGVIRQGWLERSNTDVLRQMSGLISSSRMFQACSQAARALDEALGKTFTEVAKA